MYLDNLSTKTTEHNNFQSKIIYTKTSVKLKDEKELWERSRIVISWPSYKWDMPLKISRNFANFFKQRTKKQR